MIHRIFVLSEIAQLYQMSWDEAIVRGELETVEEFETYEDAVKAFEDRDLDPELYGAE